MRLADQPWMRPSQDLAIEVRQAQDEGRDAPFLKEEADRIAAMPEGPDKETAAARLYRRVQEAPLRPNFPYQEPDSYERILAACSDVPPGVSERPPPTGAALEDAILGGWQGRVAGCMLGAPIETWMRPRIQGFLKASGNWPVTGYLCSNADETLRRQYEVADGPGNYGNPQKPWGNLLAGFAPEDDDINYTIMALLALEKHGAALTCEDVGALWLETMPMLLACTAERAAYRNLANSVFPPHTAATCNPYREWIGAQIRTDLYGYACPGRPRLAAQLAYQDAALSHTKNGVYGAMWVAALVALAFVEKDVPALLSASLEFIPRHSRLREALAGVLRRHAAGLGEDEAFEMVHRLYDEADPHDWCHTVPNAMLVASALLYGAQDFDKTIALGVIHGFDTDCNAATAGSVLGVVLGSGGVPQKWLAPFNDTVKSGLHGLSYTKISQLAARTAALARRLAQ